MEIRITKLDPQTFFNITTTKIMILYLLSNHDIAFVHVTLSQRGSLLVSSSVPVNGELLFSR